MPNRVNIHCSHIFLFTYKLLFYIFLVFLHTIGWILSSVNLGVKEVCSQIVDTFTCCKIKRRYLNLKMKWCFSLMTLKDARGGEGCTSPGGGTKSTPPHAPLLPESTTHKRDP